MSDIWKRVEDISEERQRTAETEKNSRREVIQYMAREFLGLAIGIGGIYTIMAPTESDVSIDDNVIDPSPVNSQKKVDEKRLSDWYLTPHRFERDIEGVKHKFFGVAHTRDFAEAHYDEMENLVRNSRYVISESEPPHILKKSIINNGKAYFGTIFELCKKHRKPLVFADNLTEDLDGAEKIVGSLAFMTLYQNINTVTRSRRDFIQNTFKAAASVYLFLGTSIGLNTRTYLCGKKTYEGKNEAKYFNHQIDQRNVFITHMTKIMAKTVLKDFSVGDYVLATYGKAHTKGVEYYLDHPNMYAAKKTIYSATLDTMVKDQLKVYVWSGSRWSITDLSTRIR